MTYTVPDHPAVGLVLEKMPEVFVLDSAHLGDPENEGYADPFVESLVSATEALVICIPGGKLESCSLEEAKEMLQAVIARQEAL